MKKQELYELLDKTLLLDDFKKSDISLNGVQVDTCKGEINRVAVAVDASLESITKAKEWGADRLFVHHGLFWGHPLAIKGTHFNRIQTLIKNDIALYAAHLPLDAHPLYGNNAELAKKWSEEENNYVTALNKEGKENMGYFMQDMEMDAFAYAYAVMIYKYGEVKYLYVPKVYQNNEFDRIVNEWQVAFKNEGL